MTPLLALPPLLLLLLEESAAVDDGFVVAFESVDLVGLTLTLTRGILLVVSLGVTLLVSTLGAGVLIASVLPRMEKKDGGVVNRAEEKSEGVLEDAVDVVDVVEVDDVLFVAVRLESISALARTEPKK